MSIGLWAQMAVLLMDCYIGLLGQVIYRLCIPGRAPRTKESLPNFREKCRVTRHSQVFQQVDGYSMDPRVLGRHKPCMRKYHFQNKTYCS